MGINSLDTSNEIIHSETLFSALFIEAIKLNCKESFFEFYENNDFKLSSCFPYVGETYYLPKPIIKMDVDKSLSDRKLAKNLKFVPANRYNSFINGNETIDSNFPNPRVSNTVSEHVEILSGESTPYHIASTAFEKDGGLYFILSYSDVSVPALFKKLLESLQYTGIGGKRQIGFGSFTCTRNDIPEDLLRLLNCKSPEYYITLGSYYPRDLDILDDDSYYLIVSKGGYSDVSNGSPKRKKRGFVFQEGSSFRKYCTGILDNVSLNSDKVVYRYLNPVFIGVNYE